MGMSDLVGAEQRKKDEERLLKERLRQEEDTQSVFEIRKLFKFDNEFGEYIKKGETRPVSAYTTGLMEQINDKFSKIVSQVNQK